MPKAEDIIYERMMEMVGRRDKAAMCKPHCPECGTEQVQLCDWKTHTLKFKCRACKTRFELLITKVGPGVAKSIEDQRINREGAEERRKQKEQDSMRFTSIPALLKYQGHTWDSLSAALGIGRATINKYRLDFAMEHHAIIDGKLMTHHANSQKERKCSNSRQAS